MKKQRNVRTGWTTAEVIKHLALDLTFEQLAAIGFLESRGLKFLVDFGWQNANEKALALASSTIH